MSLAGICVLSLFSAWASFFGMLALISYAFLYTPLKRVSPIAVVVGAIPGALPTLIGVVAAEGEVTALALVLFAVQFFWQFPHFWAIAWLGHGDYKKAGFKLITSNSNGEPSRTMAFNAFIYALFLVPVIASLWLFAFESRVGLFIIFGLTAVYIALSYLFYKKPERRSALQLMFFSFLYMPATLMLLYMDIL